MVKPCPGCGAATAPEAHFCRLCGRSLKAGVTRENEATVSPRAQTVPLAGEGRATEGLGADDPRRNYSDTTKVGRTEMESLLRRTSPTQKAGDDDGKGLISTKAASEATQMTMLTTTTVAARPAASPETTTQAPSAARASRDSSNLRSRRLWQAAAIALLCIALGAGALAVVLSHRAVATENSNATPIAISDTRQLVGEKLAEAETLLAAGEFDDAIKVLRAALKLDPANAEARMMLGNALERTSARLDAIGQYRTVVQSDPANISAWRALAAAQFEEQLYNDAADSYRRLLAASGNSFDDETWLAYGDALRLANRDDEARVAYQRISGPATNSAIMLAARRHLAQLRPPAVNAPSAAHTGETASAEQQQGRAPQPEPASQPPAPPPSSASAARTQFDYDGYYFQAVNIVNGRDPKKIERAELLHALALFQRAALGGAHRAEAQRYADKLGKEYDRRKNWN